jgi:hypothetical protein
MDTQGIFYRSVDFIILIATDYLMPVMAVAFVLGIIFKLLIYFTIKRQEWFAFEFAKRVQRFFTKLEIHMAEKEAKEDKVNKENKENKLQASGEEVPATTSSHTQLSFYQTTKSLLERTYYEVFIMRSILKRRNPDIIMTLGDRVFMIQYGCAWMVRETLRNLKYLKQSKETPQFLPISKVLFQQNPAFNKVFGKISITVFNDFINLLPGLFIVGGIFGTFLGIMKALPDLGLFNLQDIEETKKVMDHFLLKISYSMITSIVGIICSVMLSLVNTIYNPEKLFVGMVDRYANALGRLWNICEHNLVDFNEKDFDENKDALDALAEKAIESELRSQSKSEDEDELKPINLKGVNGEMPEKVKRP